MNQDSITNAGAAAAIVSPVWLPYIHGVSHLAAQALPVLGVVWFIVRIASTIYESYYRNERRDS